MKFEVGKTYKGVDGNEYTVLSLDENYINVKFRNVTKRFRYVLYSGNDTVIQYGKPLLSAGPFKLRFDPEIDVEEKSKSRKQIEINLNNEGYLNVFKAHCKEEN
jgi:hypothetical protein